MLRLLIMLFLQSVVEQMKIQFFQHITIHRQLTVQLKNYLIIQLDIIHENGYDNSLYIFTVPVLGKYYFYASYFTVSGSNGTVDLMFKKLGEEQKLQARGQERQSTPSTHERRTVSFNSVRLSPGTYNSSDNTIYGPYGCKLYT